jgi:hypothetical protein
MTHNPEVAGSNPAPATGKAPETGPFCSLGRRRQVNFCPTALAAAFRLPDRIAPEIVRLLLVEALVGNGHAQAVTQARVGPKDAGTREVDIEWLEPREYSNVEPQLRRVHGTWRIA